MSIHFGDVRLACPIPGITSYMNGTCCIACLGTCCCGLALVVSLWPYTHIVKTSLGLIIHNGEGANGSQLRQGQGSQITHLPLLLLLLPASALSLGGVFVVCHGHTRLDQHA